jgi:hypothetical protein
MDATYPTLPGLVPLGLGLGLTFVPITLADTSEVSGGHAGLASGLLNTAQQVGGSIGLAILSTLAASRTTSLLHGSVTPGSVPAARVSGFHVAFIAAAVLPGAAWTVAALRLRTRRVRELKRVDVHRISSLERSGARSAYPWRLPAPAHARPVHSPMTPPQRVVRENQPRRIPAGGQLPVTRERGIAA